MTHCVSCVWDLVSVSTRCCDLTPRSQSHVRFPGRDPMRGLRVQCGLGGEKEHHRIYSCWSSGNSPIFLMCFQTRLQLQRGSGTAAVWAPARLFASSAVYSCLKQTPLRFLFFSTGPACMLLLVFVAVLHWLVDHNRRSSEISWRGNVPSRLSHLWSHRHSGLPHVRQTLQTRNSTY